VCKAKANSLHTDRLFANGTQYNVSLLFKNEYCGYLYILVVVNEKTIIIILGAPLPQSANWPVMCKSPHVTVGWIRFVIIYISTSLILVGIVFWLCSVLNGKVKILFL